IHLGSMPVYSAISFAFVVAKIASMSWTLMPASRQTFCSASMASIMSVLGDSRYPISFDSAAATMAAAREGLLGISAASRDSGRCTGVGGLLLLLDDSPVGHVDILSRLVPLDAALRTDLDVLRLGRVDAAEHCEDAVTLEEVDEGGDVGHFLRPGADTAMLD